MPQSRKRDLPWWRYYKNIPPLQFKWDKMQYVNVCTDSMIDNMFENLVKKKLFTQTKCTKFDLNQSNNVQHKIMILTETYFWATD